MVNRLKQPRFRSKQWAIPLFLTVGVTLLHSKGAKCNAHHVGVDSGFLEVGELNLWAHSGQKNFAVDTPTFDGGGSEQFNKME